MATTQAPAATKVDAIVPLVRFAHGLRYADIPPAVVDTMKQHVLDVIGAGLAGTAADGIAALVGLVKDWGGKPEASIIGDGTKVPVPLAALANAAMSRALELDDVHEKGLYHPTVAAAPLALCVAEAKGGVSGKDYLAAIIAGEEIPCRMGLSPEYHVAGAKHKPRGWSFTYQCGIMGGALGAGKLLGLSETQLLDAMGNAYTALAGNQQAVQEGVLAIRAQQGLCAQTAAQSAYLAQRGINGPRQVLEGMFGWLTYWHGPTYDRDVLVGELGTRWEVANISIKPYPVCKITHASIYATLGAMSEGHLRPDDVEKITVHVNSRESWDEVVQPVPQRRAPRSSVEAQFCLPFVVAVGAARGNVTLADITPKGIRDPASLAMAQRVHPVMDPDQDVSQGRILPMPATVEIQTKDGRTVTKRCDYAIGHPKNPMSWAQVEEKFMGCAAWAAKPKDAARLREIVQMVKDLDKVRDMRELARLLV